MDDKKVLIPLEEYENLLKDKEAYVKIAEELKKDCKERGLYVEVTFTWDEFQDFERKKALNPRFRLISKDDALDLAAKEIDRLSNLLKEKADYEDKVRLMSTRNLWQRLTGKYED